MKIEIKNRWTGKVLFEATADSLKLALELAVKQDVNLAQADLYGADLDEAKLDYARLDGASLVRARLDGASLVRARLDGASLDGASLVRARLDGASLDGASLDGARLDGASLDGASLVRARLDGASLDGASLVRARLDGASLVRARLDGASLDGASLDGARLDVTSLPERTQSWFRDDLWAVLSSAPREAQGVLEALKAGKVDGSTYSGNCACLVGTIANTRGCNYQALGVLQPDSGRPAEQFFMLIRPGDTPAKSKAAKMAAGWVEEWIKNMREAFGAVAA